jgi:hypothetical protein
VFSGVRIGLINLITVSCGGSPAAIAGADAALDKASTVTTEAKPASTFFVLILIYLPFLSDWCAYFSLVPIEITSLEILLES